MTDKEIIIDGVDVSGCEDYRYFNNAHYCDLHYIRKLCEDLPNCYYKQLKRKEEECEELERQYEILQKDMLNCTACRTNSTLKTQLDQLKVENDELKKHNALLQIDNERIRADLSNYNEPFEKLLYAQKQALDEIEKAVNLNCEQTCIGEKMEENCNCISKDVIDIINKADCRQSAECFCEAKHADTFNTDNQAAKEQE